MSIATDAADSLMGELCDSGKPADLLARLEYYAEGGTITDALWREACCAYVGLVFELWCERGFGIGCRCGDCVEMRAEMNEIRRWAMPTVAAAVAAE